MFFSDQNIPSSYILINTLTKLEWLNTSLKSSPYFAFDIENSHPTVKSKDRVRDYLKQTEVKIVGISFAWGREKVEDPWISGLAAYVPLYKSEETPYWKSDQQFVVGVLKDILESDVYKVAHNGKFDVRELAKHLNIFTKNFKFDTMLAHAILDEERLVSSHALKSDYKDDGTIAKLGVSDAYLNISQNKFKKDLKDALVHFDPYYQRYSKVPIDTIYPYGCADSDLTLSLMHVFKKMLEEQDLMNLFDTIVMPLSHAVTLLELHGVPLDIERAKQVEKEQLDIQKNLEKEIYQIVGEKFLVTSDKQLGDILFNKLKISKGTRNKTGWVVDADALSKLDHPIIPPLLKHRRSEKIQGTYTSPSLELVSYKGAEITDGGKIGWVHTNYWLDTLTGRLRCNDPNFTNLPKPENGGDVVKSLWRASEGYRFVFMDESQIELRCIAHISQEPVWIEGFNRGEDMHNSMAKIVFNLPCSVEDVKKLYEKERSQVKAINFGIAYGQSVYALSQDLGISFDEADHLINNIYFGSTPVLRKWIEETHIFAEQNLYVKNIFGRIRRLPNAGLQVPYSVKWAPREERPRCYRDCVSLDLIGIEKNDLHKVSESIIIQAIKSYKKNSFYKCCACPHLKSCFINSEVKRIEGKKGHALRQAVNSKIQGSAADMTSLALIWITEEFIRERISAQPILYIHDELGTYTSVSDLEKVERIMEYCMTKKLREHLNFSVPLLVGKAIVKRWSDK